MSSLRYYSRPGRGQLFQDKYGFSEAVIIGDRMELAGQTGMGPETMKVPPTIEEEVAQAFSNINAVILYALESAKHPAHSEDKTGWDRVVKLRTYHVNLPETRDQIIELMVQQVKKWCPNHTPTWTMLGVQSLPFPEQHLEIEVDVFLG